MLNSDAGKCVADLPAASMSTGGIDSCLDRNAVDRGSNHAVFLAGMQAGRDNLVEAIRSWRREQQLRGILASKDKPKRARELHDQGVALVAIAAELKVKPATVERMVTTDPLKCYWGGGLQGRRKGDPAAVYALYHGPDRAFHTYAAIARHTGLGTVTVKRYIEEEEEVRKLSVAGNSSEPTTDN